MTAVRRVLAQPVTLCAAALLAATSLWTGWAAAGLQPSTSTGGRVPVIPALATTAAVVLLTYSATSWAFAASFDGHTLRAFTLDGGQLEFRSATVRRVSIMRLKSESRVVIDDGVHRASVSGRDPALTAIARNAITQGTAQASAAALRDLRVRSALDTLRNPLWGLRYAGLIIVPFVGGFLLGFAIGYSR